MYKTSKNDCCKVTQKSIKSRTYLQWIIAITANLALLTYGMQSGWMSPTIKVFQSNSSPTGDPLDDNEISWIGSVMGLAAAVAVPFFSYMADVYGRKRAIIVASGMQLIGWALKIYAGSTLVIIVARVFCGFATGACFVVIPMYVREISQDDIRGLVGSLLVMFQNAGYLIMFAIGAYLDYNTVLWTVLWLPILTIALMAFAPESPAYLMKSGRIEEATNTIAQLRRLNPDSEVVQKEIDSMKKEDLYFKSLPNVSYLSILQEKAWRRSFFLMMALIFFHASSGSFALVTYASAILSSSSSAFNTELQTLSFPAVMLLAGFISMTCVERFGRKPVLAVSLTLIALSKLCIGAVILVQRQCVLVPWWIPLTAMIVNVFSYAFGLSPVPFVILSEIFNFQIRAKALGVIVTLAWVLSFVQLLMFTRLAVYVGLEGVFFIFAVINIIGLFFTVLMIPETKGKSVEQIENELRSK